MAGQMLTPTRHFSRGSDKNGEAPNAFFSQGLLNLYNKIERYNVYEKYI